MGEIIEMSGKRFGMLLVLGYDGRNKWGRANWKCQCDCGNEAIVDGNHLRSGDTQSCGCARFQKLKDGLRFQHGMSKTRIYKKWYSMINRCRDVTDTRYGGRGIKVCPRWTTFENFYTDMGNPPPEHTLDRRNNDGPYSPENCRWAVAIIQANNRRGNRRLTCRGKVQTIAEWSRESGIEQHAIKKRILRGWPIEKSIFFPSRKNKSSRIDSNHRA